MYPLTGPTHFAYDDSRSGQRLRKHKDQGGTGGLPPPVAVPGSRSVPAFRDTDGPAGRPRAGCWDVYGPVDVSIIEAGAFLARASGAPEGSAPSCSGPALFAGALRL